jgi:nitroimidazol reductase NimA-like FMN-containing flavoprotein (pyridoxamine 5'-phosphate oxidase superfamily)
VLRSGETLVKRLSSTLKDFVEKQELVRIAWIDGGGARVVPVWFVIVDREHYIGTGSDSAKWRAMKKRPRVGWVIDGGKKGKYKGLSMHGEAEEVTDRKLRGRLYAAFGRKYFGSADHPKHKEIWGEVDDPGSVFVHLKATDGFWWEY